MGDDELDLRILEGKHWKKTLQEKKPHSLHRPVRFFTSFVGQGFQPLCYPQHPPPCRPTPSSTSTGTPAAGMQKRKIKGRVTAGAQLISPCNGLCWVLDSPSWTCLARASSCFPGDLERFWSRPFPHPSMHPTPCAPSPSWMFFLNIRIYFGWNS